MRRVARSPILLALLLACGSDGPSNPQVIGACTASAEKTAILGTARQWYLYQDLLPSPLPDPGDGSTPSEFLDALTANARAKGEDRGWSYLLATATADRYFQQGQSVGFGIGFKVVGTQLLIAQVMRGSPADQDGFKRGDEVRAIGATPTSMTPVATLLASQTGLTDALAGGAGTTISFSVVPVGQTLATTRTMTKAPYDLDPVVPRVVTDPVSGANVGFLHLRTFVSTADQRLRDAFAAFRADPTIQGVIVDVRYNGGGLLDTAEVLASLLHASPADKPFDLMYRFTFDAQQASSDSPVYFHTEAAALPVVQRVAFITTDGTASASELVPNVLAPYFKDASGTPNLAVVGARTYGKPVGQEPFMLGGQCTETLYLISFRLDNEKGFGGYYSGLPATGFDGASCAADDDLAHEQGDPGEASTRAALQWVTTGTCPSGAIAPASTAGALTAAAPSLRRLTPPDPSPAQRDIPGLF